MCWLFCFVVLLVRSVSVDVLCSATRHWLLLSVVHCLPPLSLLLSLLFVCVFVCLFVWLVVVTAVVAVTAVVVWLLL